MRGMRRRGSVFCAPGGGGTDTGPPGADGGCSPRGAAHEWRRRTGIEPARPRYSVSPVLKTGAPTSAVMMPTSSSPLGSTTRPSVSESTSRIAPNTAENGRSQRWSGPVSSRAACGTARPTKAIGPVAAVAAPHSRTMAIAVHNRMRPIRAPSAAARSSPSASAFSDQPNARAISAPTARNGATVPKIARSRPAREPTCQNRISWKTKSWKRMTPLVRPSRTALTAVPARASRTGVALVRPRVPRK